MYIVMIMFNCLFISNGIDDCDVRVWSWKNNHWVSIIKVGYLLLVILREAVYSNFNTPDPFNLNIVRITFKTLTVSVTVVCRGEERDALKRKRQIMCLQFGWCPRRRHGRCKLFRSSREEWHVSLFSAAWDFILLVMAVSWSLTLTGLSGHLICITRHIIIWYTK